MKTVAFVPIKLNNERLPGKNVKTFSDGTPLVHFVEKALLKVKEWGKIDEVYIFCSNDDIIPYVLEGVQYLKRPAHLDHKDMKGTEIYQTFVDMVEADIYVLAHATSPFVTAEHIADCVDQVKSGDYDSAFCGKKIQNFLWKEEKPLNFELGNPPRTQDMTPIYQEIATPFVFTKEVFQQFHSRTGVKPFICTCSDLEGIDIDYESDFRFADFIYSKEVLE